MAVIRRTSPGWATWILLGGLVALFLGERVFGHIPTARLVLSGAGLAALLSMTVWRARVFLGASGPARRVERLLLLGSAGCTVAVGLYFASTDAGLRLLSLAPATPEGRARLGAALMVSWLILLGASLLPLLFAQWTAARGSDEAVEETRVREAAGGGLTVALAAALLFVVGYVAAERDVKWDVSYFRTSLPGTATESIVASLSEPLRVLLFFPDVNEVKDEVRSYFRELQRRTGRVEIEAHDRMASPRIAKEHNVHRDGTVVLVRGKQSETITLDTELRTARAMLRNLDSEVQKALMKVARGARVAYVTTGHGEMTDAEVTADDPFASAQILREALGLLNYRVSELGLKQGLASDVPEDATLVLVVGPKKPFLDEELAALDRYLERGGALLLALDAAGELRLGPLEQRLGLRFDPTPLADERQHVRRRGNPSDRRLIITDQFSAHASVTTLSRSRVGAGILAPHSGSLVEVAETGPAEDRPRRTFVVRSLPSTFADANGNHEPDPDEKRASYNLAAAVEGGKAPAADGGEAEPRAMRVMVLAAAQMVSDAVLANIALNAALLGDAIKWLGGEEKLAGETTSEKDVPIEHTRGQDVAWFYSTIVGAPLLVLGVGLALTLRRRRGRKA
jgi:hypothetical protein